MTYFQNSYARPHFSKSVIDKIDQIHNNFIEKVSEQNNQRDIQIKNLQIELAKANTKLKIEQQKWGQAQNTLKELDKRYSQKNQELLDEQKKRQSLEQHTYQLQEHLANSQRKRKIPNKKIKLESYYDSPEDSQEEEELSGNQDTDFDETIDTYYKKNDNNNKPKSVSFQGLLN